MTQLAPGREAARYRVTFELPTGQVRTVEAGGEEYILTAGRRAGLELPSRCEVGWDLVCAVRVLSGEVDHTDARRYFAQDRNHGFALICRGKPRSDLRLLTHQATAMRDHRDAHGLPTPRAV